MKRKLKSWIEHLVPLSVLSSRNERSKMPDPERVFNGKSKTCQINQSTYIFRLESLLKFKEAREK